MAHCSIVNAKHRQRLKMTNSALCFLERYSLAIQVLVEDISFIKVHNQDTVHELRENISFYHLNDQDEMRNIIRGHYQPLQHEFHDPLENIPRATIATCLVYNQHKKIHNSPNKMRAVSKSSNFCFSHLFGP